jgi:SpoVK/Ycf46/Vps4 family AAA+-type ATPase
LRYVIDFLEAKDITKSIAFEQLKCSKEEAEILRYLVKEYITGSDTSIVLEVLTSLYEEENFEYLKKIIVIKSLLDLGWIVQTNFIGLKVTDITDLELINSPITLSNAFFKLLDRGSLDLVLPEVTEYRDHLEYLQDQFFMIDIYQQLSSARHNHKENSPSVNRLKNKLQLIENRVQERLKVTTTEIELESFFKENELNDKEQIIFLAILKEEYASDDSTLREMNILIDMISFDDYDRIKNRALLEENSKLVESGLVGYDEILTPFGSITRNFFIPEDILHTITHPQDKKKAKKEKVKLEMLVKEQEIFEYIEPKTSLDDVVLNPKTKDTLNNLLRQMDKKVIGFLKEWGIKDKKKGISARIIFYGPAGTGKTMTAYSLAKSLKRGVLSFDCSKILSMYVGESEKNVRKIFDEFKEIAQKSRVEPVLLLNEADQFLSSRGGATHSTDKMHNQMQNIFLEQIERFDGILIATTNLLENIDSAFSRRFNYKIEFAKPNFDQRVELWKKMLPQNAPMSDDIDIEKLANHKLTGGQINLIINNTAYKVACKDDEVIFCMSDFVNEIDKELKGNFDSEKSMGFSLN